MLNQVKIGFKSPPPKVRKVSIFFSPVAGPYVRTRSVERLVKLVRLTKLLSLGWFVRLEKLQLSPLNDCHFIFIRDDNQISSLALTVSSRVGEGQGIEVVLRGESSVAVVIVLRPFVAEASLEMDAKFIKLC